MEALNLIRLFLGGGFSLTQALYTPYTSEYLHFSYLKCLVTEWMMFVFCQKKVKVEEGFHHITLPETNIAPENGPSQEESSLPIIHFQVLC